MSLSNTALVTPNSPEELEIRRADIWYVNLGEGRVSNTSPKFKSSVQRGIRPCAVCQSDKGSHSGVFLVAPVSGSVRRPYPFIQNIHLFKKSYIHYEQITTVSRGDFIEKVGRLSKEQIMEMDLRSPVALGLSETSYLHIKRITLMDIQVNPQRNVVYYNGKVELEFFDRYFSFSNLDFLKYFGNEKSYVLESGLTEISSFLETLSGLKFMYTVINDYR